MKAGKFFRYAAIGTVCFALAAPIGMCSVAKDSYYDAPGFSDKTQNGRTRNSLAALIGGIVAQQAYGTSTIDLKVEKRFWPDTSVTGSASKDSIDTYVDLALTSARFTAKKNKYGLFEGEVSKSEFDWNVEQISHNTWEVKRLLFKWNTKLVLNIADGKIHGTYHRPIGSFNWGIDGTYDSNGNVDIDVNCPLALGLRLKGKVQGSGF